MSYSNKLSEDAKITFMDYDPDKSDTLTQGVQSNITWIDMEGYHAITAIAFRTVGTGVVQAAALYAASDGTGTGATIIGTALGSTGASGLLGSASSDGASAGMVVLEATHDEIANALSGATHVQVRLSPATGTDEFGICVIRHRARYPKTGLTASGDGR